MYKKRYNIQKIISLFLGDYKREIHLREIGRQASLPLRTTQNLLSELEKESILKGETEGRNKYFSLNLRNPLTKLHLIQVEIYKTIFFLEKYPLLKPFVNELDGNIPVIVFGSFAKMTAGKKSDIDILIVGRDKLKKSKTLPLDIVPFEIHEVNISGETLELSVKSGEALIKEIQKHHVVLNNHSYYVCTMWKYAKH